MNKKILFVDDEPNVLQSIRRSLRKEFDVDTAEGGEEALTKLKANGTYAIIVSDMRMPGMNGVELLAQAKKDSPDTVRMMLTGNADQQTAVDAVNHGDIYRFLNKPCGSEQLINAITNGLRQHELITAERELLEETLKGSITALAEVLSLSNPEVFGKTNRLKNQIVTVAAEMGLTDQWQFESAAMLSQIGCVTVSQDLLRRRLGGHQLADDEKAEYAAHAKIGADIVAKIPRMEVVAEAVRYQEKNYDGSGYPKDGVKGDAIPLGARILKILLDFDAYESGGAPAADALLRIKEDIKLYDPAVLVAFEKTMLREMAYTIVEMSIMKLTDAMVLAEDVVTAGDNTLLIAKGQETTLSARRHLQNFRDKGFIGNSVKVLQVSE